MAVIINQRHSIFSNVETYLDGVEGHIFFNVLNTFDYQGEKVLSLDYVSENPEIDADFLRRNKIVRISYDENQPHNISQEKLGKGLNIVGPCSLQPYDSKEDFSFKLSGEPSLSGNRLTLRIEARWLPEDNLNKPLEQVICEVPDNKITQVQSWISRRGSETEHTIKGIDFLTASFGALGDQLIIKDFTTIVKKGITSSSLPQSQIVDTPQFTIELGFELDLFANTIVLRVEPFDFQGKRVEHIAITTNNPNLKKGSKVIVKGIKYESGKAEINNNYFNIHGHFADIEIVSVETGGEEGDNSTPKSIKEIFQEAINNNDSQLITLLNKYEGLTKDIFLNIVVPSLAESELNADRTINYVKVEEIIKTTYTPNSDLNKYKNGVLADINNELNNGDNVLKPDELEESNKDYEKQLENAQSPEQVNQIREKVKNDAGEKKTQKELDNLLEKAKRATTDAEKLFAKFKLLQFTKEENHFKKIISQKNEKEIKEALNWLENHQSTSQPSKNSNSLVYYLVGGVILTVVVVIAIFIKRIKSGGI